MNRNILIHDYFENFGGGERLVLSINKLFPELITSFINEDIKKKIKFSKVNLIDDSKKLSILKKINLINNFKKLDIENCNNLLCSGNYSIFVNSKKAKNKIVYIHSLPKIYFRSNDFYKKNKLLKKLFNIKFRNYGKEYISSIRKFDKIIVNSKFTKKSLKKYFKKKIQIIYPPIQKKIFKEGVGDYYLSNNRHEHEKNIDIIIKVFSQLNDKKLIISSKGSQTQKLKKLSKNLKNIKFVGVLSNKKYHKYLSKCIATINISSKEDFGMAALEGMVYGKPTFCLNEGGYLETTKNKLNSIHINRSNIFNDLKNKIKLYNVDKLSKMAKNCKKTANSYSEKNFHSKIKKLLIN